MRLLNSGDVALAKARRVRRFSLLLVLGVVASLAPPAQADHAPIRDSGRPNRLDATIQELAKRQLDQLGIPEAFLPFLRDDAKVRTGREMFAIPAPDLNRRSGPELLETDLRYSYAVGEGQQGPLPADFDVDTRIVVRTGATGKKLWAKSYDRDAWPFAMRVGPKGRPGVVVISGIWNFYGTTEESTLAFDAFAGKSGKHLWSRQYKSVSYYELVTYVAEDAPLVLAPFNGIEGRATDLMLALATWVSSPLATTMSTRVIAIDGRDGSEHVHPIVDVGVDWWPVPLPTRDLDGDGLDDYATTNNFGVDGGDPGSQQPPAIGGTVYTRKGNTGLPIWTTSGIEMSGWAFTDGLPDVAGDRTPDLAVITYVEGKRRPLIPEVPLLTTLGYRERIYLLEGKFGAVAWHKPWEWVYSPGDIDRHGKRDLLFFKYRASFKKGRTTYHQLAANGAGQRLWRRRSVWRFETMPCPRGFCFGWYWLDLDVSPDVQPDRVKDALMNQGVEQNEAFRDSITRLYDGRTGRVRFQDETALDSADVAIDGRGTDLLAFEHKNDKVRVSARNGWNRTLWSAMVGGPNKILSRRSWFWGTGFVLPGDRCGDIVINGSERSQSFYAVVDGADARLLWSRWTGPKDERPRITRRTDGNARC